MYTFNWYFHKDYIHKDNSKFEPNKIEKSIQKMCGL